MKLVKKLFCWFCFAEKNNKDWKGLTMLKRNSLTYVIATSITLRAITYHHQKIENSQRR